MKNVMILSAVAAMTAGTAFAGGIAEPVATVAPAPVMAAPVAVITNDWSGFYAGGQIGTGSVETDTTDLDLTSYGVQAGYLYDLGSFVVGGEASYAALDVDDIDTDGSYVARAGVIAGYDAGRFMPYITGGYAYLNAETDGVEENDSGYYYGVGANYAVTDSVLVGVEYLEHKFDDFNDTGIDAEANTTSLKVSYKF